MKPARVDVEVYDTTLRDGTQREGLSLTCDDKLRIARRLDALGVAVIEAGFPGSNPKDAELFRRARDVDWKTASLAAFGATRRADVHVEDDASLGALVEAGTPVCTIFGKADAWQVEVVLRVSRDENLRMIEESVAFLAAAGRRVIYDAEHFFDGFARDAGYALETLRAAERGGASALILCDTNGGSLPWDVETAVRAAGGAVLGRLGIHAHDDAACAVANTLAAVRAGARHVQGTVNGYGERCGNADLCAILPGLELKLGLSALAAGKLAELVELSKFVAEVANLPSDEHRPYVGRSAFAHKGGVHVAATRRAAGAYQHVDPARVGNASRVVVSELSGRGSVRSKAEELGVTVGDGADRLVVGEIKAREAMGSSYEVAEGSVALLLRRRAEGYVAPFRVHAFQVLVSRREGAESEAEATIKMEVGGQTVHTAAEGSGPVAALDAALRKALISVFPAAARIRLTDYKVRILDGRDGTCATTRVLVDSSDGENCWTTVGAARSILDASFEALADGYEVGLAQVGAGRVAVAEVVQAASPAEVT